MRIKFKGTEEFAEMASRIRKVKLKHHFLAKVSENEEMIVS